MILPWKGDYLKINFSFLFKWILPLWSVWVQFHCLFFLLPQRYENILLSFLYHRTVGKIWVCLSLPNEYWDTICLKAFFAEADWDGSTQLHLKIWINSGLKLRNSKTLCPCSCSISLFIYNYVWTGHLE